MERMDSLYPDLPTVSLMHVNLGRNFELRRFVLVSRRAIARQAMNPSAPCPEYPHASQATCTDYGQALHTLMREAAGKGLVVGSNRKGLAECQSKTP
jgi:hypothetical protein